MKFNKKQKKIMRVFGSFLFVVALVLTLDLIFNHQNKNDEFIGTWYMGYKIYIGDSNKLKSKLDEELVFSLDGTFYVNETYEPVGIKTSVSGTYKVNGNSIVLKYSQQGLNKTETLIFKDDKLCMTNDCDRYYTKDELKEYFVVNDKSESEE